MNSNGRFFFLIIEKVGRKKGEKPALVRKIQPRTIAKFKAGKTVLLISWQWGCYALVERSKIKRQQSVKRRTLQWGRSCQLLESDTDWLRIKVYNRWAFTGSSNTIIHHIYVGWMKCMPKVGQLIRVFLLQNYPSYCKDFSKMDHILSICSSVT